MRFKRTLALVLAVVFALSLCAVGSIGRITAASAETTESAEQDDPAGSSEPAATVEPETPAETVGTEEPSETGSPEEPADTEEPDAPSATAQPEATEEPVETEEPIESEEPDHPAQQTEPEEPAEPENTDYPDGTAETEAEAEPTEITDTTELTGNVWTYINALESESLHPKRGSKVTAEDFSAFSDDLVQDLSSRDERDLGAQHVGGHPDQLEPGRRREGIRHLPPRVESHRQGLDDVRALEQHHQNDVDGHQGLCRHALSVRRQGILVRNGFFI